MVCPQCGRIYEDPAFRYCKDCGVELKDLSYYPAPPMPQAYYKTYTETYDVRSGFTVAAAALSVPACIICAIFSTMHGLSIGAVSATACFAGLILSVIGLVTISRRYVLAGAIGYSCTFVFPLFGIVYMILPIVFAWIGYGTMRKKRTVFIDENKKSSAEAESKNR